MGSALRIGLALVVASASAVALSCGGDDGGDITDPGSDTGAIRATVTQDGTAAPGVTVRLYTAGGSSAQSTQTTGGDGNATFGSLSPGGYDVEVVLPAGTELVEGAPRRSVTAQAGATATVTFALASEAAGDVVEVVVRGNLTFSPEELTIEPGTTVRWRNEEAMLHTITPDGHTEWNEGTVTGAGDVFTHTFTSAGTFPYFCAPHLSAGMTGVVTVQ